MKVAIFQGFSFHNEMIGYVLDYCRARAFQVSLYTHNSDWLQLYKDVFGPIPNKPIQEFNPDAYDAIFLLTDDDPMFQQDWLQKHASKVVCIDHYVRIRREPVGAHVATRPFSKVPRPWALPCFHMINPEFKYHHCKPVNLEEARPLVVTCLGVSAIPKELRILKDLFGAQFSQIDFHLIGHQMPHYPDANEYPNVSIHRSLPTLQMAQVLEKTTHLLCLHKEHLTVPHAADYEDCSMSGSLPFAFNYMCQLLIPDTWQREYQFTSAIPYKLGQTLTVSFDDFLMNIPKIAEERVRLVEGRNAVFDEALRTMKSQHLRLKLRDKLNQFDRKKKPKKKSQGPQREALIQDGNAQWR